MRPGEDRNTGREYRPKGNIQNKVQRDKRMEKQRKVYKRHRVTTHFWDTFENKRVLFKVFNHIMTTGTK